LEKAVYLETSFQVFKWRAMLEVVGRGSVRTEATGIICARRVSPPIIPVPLRTASFTETRPHSLTPALCERVGVKLAALGMLERTENKNDDEHDCLKF
jgi:hypothetical protein